MDGNTKTNTSEGVPLNSTGAANIFLNTGKRTKVNNHDGTVIQLHSGKPADVGVHINTTLSIASSKKIKFLFMMNFLLSFLCLVISFSVAIYYWKEIIAMQKQVESMKDQLFLESIREGLFRQGKVENNLPMTYVRSQPKDTDLREPRMNFDANHEMSQNSKRYYVEDLGEDMLLVDSKKKKQITKTPIDQTSSPQKEFLVTHFNGAIREINLGTQSIIGPWVRDVELSSKDSESKIELNSNYIRVKESGIYLIYAQVVYLTHAPSCYFIWARQPAMQPRLLSTCATGDDSTSRPLEKAQISCAVQTVARLIEGDTINLAQREHNRTLWLRPGYTYFGLIKLTS